MQQRDTLPFPANMLRLYGDSVLLRDIAGIILSDSHLVSNQRKVLKGHLGPSQNTFAGVQGPMASREDTKVPLRCLRIQVRQPPKQFLSLPVQRLARWPPFVCACGLKEQRYEEEIGIFALEDTAASRLG